MKRSVKLISIILAIVLTALAVSGCKLSFEDEEENNSQTETESDVESLSTRKAKISIIQYMNYTSLNECCEGVRKSLDEAGYEYDVTVGSDISAESDCEEKAKDIAVNGGYDMIITIGTPASISVYSSVSAASRIPVIFCAVTDPLGANLVLSESTPTNNCTGISSAFDVKKQLDMINTFQPSITKLGVVYTKGEQNSESQLKILKEEAKKLNINVYDEAVSIPTEMADAADELFKTVDAITFLADNMTCANSWNIINRGIVSYKPVYGVTADQIKDGCMAGYCFDFKAMGTEAGKTASEVLRGQSAANTPIIKFTADKLYVNRKTVDDLYFAVPEIYSDAEYIQ